MNIEAIVQTVSIFVVFCFSPCIIKAIIHKQAKCSSEQVAIVALALTVLIMTFIY